MDRSIEHAYVRQEISQMKDPAMVTEVMLADLGFKHGSFEEETVARLTHFWDLMTKDDKSYVTELFDKAKKAQLRMDLFIKELRAFCTEVAMRE